MTNKYENKCQIINLEKYLNHLNAYLNLSQNLNFQDLKKATHWELKHLIPELQKLAVSFEYAQKDPTRHILVKDAKGKLGAYKNITYTRNKQLNHLIGDTTMILPPENPYFPENNVSFPKKKKKERKNNER